MRPCVTEIPASVKTFLTAFAYAPLQRRMRICTRDERFYIKLLVRSNSPAHIVQRHHTILPMLVARVRLPVRARSTQEVMGGSVVACMPPQDVKDG